ncbi:hypothetical protein GCM10028777_02660 [Angustibacter speluncae]
MVRAPAPDVVLATVESLPRDGHAVLQSADGPQVYVQVWFRFDGTCQRGRDLSLRRPVPPGPRAPA